MQQALIALHGALRRRDYSFTTVTPETHARVLRNRGGASAGDLRDVFGWSVPFAPRLLEPSLLGLLRQADAVTPIGSLLRSKLRATTLHGRLYLHSAYPTDQPDAVFLGPDSCRFADFIRADLAAERLSGDVLDIGGGAGVGAIVASDHMDAARVVLTDINSAAVRLAKVNAKAAEVEVETVLTADARSVGGLFQLVLANPPFIADDEHQLPYRHGGGALGAEATIDFVKQGLSKVAPGGRLLLYTGSAIVRGVDAIRLALEEVTRDAGLSMSYREVDPDIFGEQLAEPPYRSVERIAAVTARIQRPR